MTSEAGSEATGTSNSSNSVISSSNYCGVKSGVPTSLNASINNLRNNAHHGVSNSNATNSLQTSQCSSILDQRQHSMSGGTTQNNSSNSQQSPKSGWGANPGGDNSTMWSGINDGSQGNNQNIIGAKGTNSEMHHSAPLNHSLNGQLEQDVRSSECRDRFGNEAISGNSNQIQGSNASLGRPFINCNGGGNGGYGNGHSINSQMGQQSHIMAGDNFHNPNSFGAQYGSSSQAHRPNSQVTDTNSSSNNSPFSGWQGPNISANPPYKGWNNIPDPSRNSFISHANHPNTSDNSGQRTNTPCSNNGNNNMSSNNNGTTNNNNANGGNAISSRESSNDIYEGLIGATGGSLSSNEELSRNGNNSNQRDGANWGMPPPRAMGLLGGGESSLNANTTAGGWGAPPSSGTSGWGSRHEQGETTGLSPQKPPHNTWAQAAAGKGISGEGETNSNNSSGNGNADVSVNNKLREEQDIKLVAAFSDGWGQANVNQDTTWEVPLSPQGSGSKEGAPLWRPQANNGTEIWENNIRHRAKNVPPTQQPQQQPWGHHTPSTHIGGTWGEEEDNPNMWTGVPAPTGNNWNEENRNMWGENCGHDTGTTVWNAAGNNKPQNIGTWSGAAPIKKEGPQPSGWEEPSPPTTRRTITGNFDDGTAVWGNPGRQGKVSHWKDTTPSKPPPNPAGMIRLPPGATGKPDGGMWGGNKGPRGGWGEASWEDPSHPATSIKHSPSFGAWGDQTSPLNAYWGAKPKSVNHSNSWSEGQIDTSSWGGPSKLGGKPLSKDLIWASKQFRVLSEMGFKKDDVENALRNNNMVFDATLNELQASSNLLRAADNMMMEMDGHGGKRPGENDDMCLSDPTVAMDGTFPSANFHGFQNSQVPPTAFGGFKAQMKASSNTPASLLNTAASLGVPASSLNSINTLNPAIVQKLLLQQQTQYNPHANIAAPGHLSMSGTAPAPAGRLSQQNMPSSQPIRHMLQQIQMAVQAGHLNPQILNYPLAPQTLTLLFQLLNQIKALHQLQQQFGGPKGAVSPQINVQITQTKQRIHNLQNQIAAQQAMFLKQHQVMPPPHTVDPFKVDPNMLHSDFRELSMKDPTTPVSSNSQSRLNQWKLPSFDKDEGSQQVPTTSSSNGNIPISVATTNNSTEFSRAPGPVSKSSAPLTSSSSSSLHPLLVQGDGTWSNAPRGSGSTQDSNNGWPDSAPPTTSSTSSENNKENSPPATTTAQPTSSSYNLTDLVPEFEPGKPWKGTSQMKNIEDDPHLTPGSVAKSPLSVNTIKDTDLFGWTSKSSPMTGDNNLASSLVPNPWAYTPTTSAPLVNNAVGKPNNLKGLGWGSLEPSGGATDLWGASLSKARGPPPGLAKGANTWGRPGWSGTGGWDRQPSSNFLVLRNLTPQIDGSTLKTLCMQHGPLQLFHLFLNHGIALARYTTREEAAKAQSALNNCVLGNTTILVDIPTEAEVQQYLHLGGWAGNGRTFAPAPAAAKDGYGGGAAMWSFSPAPPPATPWEHDTNPPTSFLPGDLLGGESM